jgi:uncharacterized protein YjbJ (UPF0337 family)
MSGTGNVNSIIGGVKEEVGRTVGNANLTQAGSEQRNDGNAEVRTCLTIVV